MTSNRRYTIRQIEIGDRVKVYGAFPGVVVEDNWLNNADKVVVRFSNGGTETVDRIECDLVEVKAGDQVTASQRLPGIVVDEMPDDSRLVVKFENGDREAIDWWKCDLAKE